MSERAQTYHSPVMPGESVGGLNIRPGGYYVDVTFGGGGHSAEILKRLGNGRLLAFDQDQDALGNRISDDRLILQHNNFRYLKNFLRYHRMLPVHGILADLGVSSHQLDEAQRGFSLRFEAPLDLRMNREGTFTAADVVRDYPQDKLAAMFRQYGELQDAGRLASVLVKKRMVKPIITTTGLREAIAACIDRKAENRYLARVFQALRIEVNGELDALREMLQQSLEVLAPGGRLVVISYHSLEDRIVKDFMKSGNFRGEVEKDFYGNPLTPFRMVTRKPLTPSENEQNENPRSRSAKLRIAEKNPDE